MWVNSARLHRQSQLSWKWLSCLLGSLAGTSEGEEHLEEGREKDLWASSSFGWALAAWEAAGVSLEPPSSPWDCTSKSASPEVTTSLLSLFKDNLKCMTGNSRENRRIVGIAEDLSPARGDVLLLWNQTSLREQSCKFIWLFFFFTCSIDLQPAAVGSWRDRFVNFC